MKILSIGNSFSEDAQRYLHSVAKAGGDDFYTVNLCIGGCSFERHSENLKENNRAYVFQENGVITERLMTLEEGVTLEAWDVITIQQVSTHSFIEESFYPYIFELVEFIRQHAPRAKLIIHETWAYAEGCDRINEVFGEPSSEKMQLAIRKAYDRAKTEVGADAIIPSGDMLLKLAKSGVGEIYRDTMHASLGLGRYALSLLWYRSLTGKSVLDNGFTELDEPITDKEILTAKKCVEMFGKII